MTPDRRDDQPDDLAENGVLDENPSVDTAGIGILGARTGHVRLTLPADTDDLVDDEAVDDVALEEIPAHGGGYAADAEHDEDALRDGDVTTGELILDDEPALEDTRVEDVHDADVIEESAPVDDESVDEGSDEPEASADPDAAAAHDDPVDAEPVEDEAPAPAEDSPADDAAADEPAVDEPAAVVDEPAAAASVEPGTGPADIAAPASAPAPIVMDAAPTPAAEPLAPAPAASVPVGEPVPLTGAVPTSRRAAHHADELARGDRAHGLERVRHPQQDLDLTSKRLGEFEPDRESADLLTADRLLDRGQLSGAEPEGLWQQFVYAVSRHRINLGDSRRVRERKELDRRIAGALPGGARFVPVVSRKGGVGKTTVTTLLGMALASARDDRVIAIDANPDRGTLADRIGRTGGRTVRDLARVRGEVTGFNDISTIVARDETRLDVLASDADPRVSEAFSDRDYHDVAALAAHYYSIVLTDTGTGIVHSVMGATLELSDQLVVVAGLSVDEARLASETLTWLETNGYADQVRRAVVVLNNARPGAPLVRESELETHFRTRVRAVVRMPYDPLIGSGSAISFRDLQPATRDAARQLAAAVVEGLRAGVVAA